MNNPRILIALATLLLSLPALAQQARPETFIKWRQSAYQVLVWNSYRIRSSLEGQYNRDDVIKAATIINALANGGLGGLYPAGTDQGKGWRDTTVKPELFHDGARVRELAGRFGREAEDLLKVAGSGDAAAVKAQYGRLSQSCKGCHEEFKVKE
jgi:cytochrome c556